MEPRICLVTGASSGIGSATALELLGAGHTVYGAARRVARMEGLRRAGGHPLAMDITDPGDVERVVRTVLDAHGRLDVLVNNAGAGLRGAIEDVPVDEARRLFEVNLFGLAELTRAVLPHMRERRSGLIVNISSIGGEVSLPLAAWYYASKHALEGYSDSLRQEVRRFGVNVVVIQPGLVRTEFDDGMSERLRAVSGQGAYRDVAEAQARAGERIYAPGGKVSDPRVVARTVLRALGASSPRPRYAVGYLARPLLLLDRLLPAGLFDRIVAR
ncbi:short-chain dehydrogenase/reductase [Sphaerisporangium rufum]|uniref:Short-chain dehydrogenase/reductase n=1 Tax=Sphaerisporangium rufum TaxID=1381558 RepID=A0A919UZ45_9ACTN|nr:oxidoreductase [Sphaerisporangium rufum]GII75163.1 short-chain dehydrogenase/reductase [Sphaerisporangium rufum]